MKWLPIFLVFSSIQPLINAQSHLSLGFHLTGGSFLTSKSKAELIRDSYVRLAELYMENKTSGKREWERAHHLPSYGVGYVFGNSGSKQYIGNIHAVAGFIKTSVFTDHTFFRLSAGPGWVTKPYDIYTNPKNTMIGTSLNAYIMMMLTHHINITPQFSIDAGISFLHLSNGGTTLPNAGLNVPGITAAINYALKKPSKSIEGANVNPNKTTKSDVGEGHLRNTTNETDIVITNFKTLKVSKDAFKANWQYQLIYSVGAKQAPWVGSDHHLIQALSFEARKRFGASHSYGLGASAYINNSIPFNPLLTPADKQNEKRFQLLIYGLYEHHFGKLSIPIHAGAYLYNHDRFPVIFEEFGIRYRFNKHVGSQVMLKIHTGQADFIHSGISYAF